MKKVAIYHHLGLGDSIECNGMIRSFSKKYDIVDIFAKPQYFDMVRYMYRDDDSIVVNLVSQGIKNERLEVDKFFKDYDGEKIIPGHNNYFRQVGFFQEQEWGPAEGFYYLAEIPWHERIDSFYFKRDKRKEDSIFKKMIPKNKKYVFVHDDPDRGYDINIDTDYAIVKNDKSVNLFDMIKIFEKAEEIHCMSSSILCLVDCLSKQCKFKKLILHKGIKPVNLGPNSLSGDWKIV